MKKKFLIAIIVAFSALFYFGIFPKMGSKSTEIINKENEIDPLVPYVKVHDVWSPSNFDQFLTKCSSERLRNLELIFSEEPPHNDKNHRISKIKKDLTRESSNIFEYPFKDKDHVDYHKAVQWTAKRHGIPKNVIESSSTFILERLIFENIFKDAWEKLTIEKRKELLNEIVNEHKGDHSKENLDIVELSTMGGTVALATLSTTVYFTGFSFYTTMSLVICKVAAFFGVTIPFAAYAGAATSVACLSGPIGWGLISIGTAASIALLGRADLPETSAFIIQMHILKVVALKNSGWKIPEPNPELRYL